MAKKSNAIYAPGELSRVRQKLGVTDQDEAKRMAQILGGEVGTERNLEADATRVRRTRRETVELMVDGRDSRRLNRRIDFTPDDAENKDSKSKFFGPYPGDDPSVPAKLSYVERVKIDQFAGQYIFEIKNSMQVLTSILSFFREPIDYVNHRFVTKRMNEYYQKIEKLVTSTRNLFPKNNIKRNNQLKRISPFVYKVLDVIRNWNIEQIASKIAELQSNPRYVKVSDFTELIRDIYKPIFILSDLNMENIKTALKLLYKILFIESPMEAKGKYQDIIRTIISSMVEIRRDVQFGLYPILMKLISDRFIPYERFFIERRNRYMALLSVTNEDQLNAADLATQQIDNIDVESLQKNLNDELPEGEESPDGSPQVEEEDESLNDPKVIARRAKEEAERAEQKALEQGQIALEAVFPKAGWDKLGDYPDLYPYFAKVYNLRYFELISPTDSLQQIIVLMQILDDMFIGMRYVIFDALTVSDDGSVKPNEELGDIINNWRASIDNSFSKEYLPRLSEYCRILENSEEARSSIYARKNMNELHWIRRLYFLPFYKFESIGPPPFQKQDINPIYSQIRNLRIKLTEIAKGIEQGIRSGGAAANAQCDGIRNPWDAYNFQVPNPISRRLDLLLPPERRTNATLIFFSLSAVTILDFIVNNENSWTYNNRSGPLFRSLKNEGITPVFGIDNKLDADLIFKDSLKKKTT